MTTLVVIVFITLFISGSCSLFESVLYSSRMGTLESATKKHPKSTLAKQLIDMKLHISQPIAAILILNTIANTAGATLAGMYAFDVLGAGLVPAFSIAFTLGILFFSEIAPKTIGAVHWRRYWPSIVRPLRIMKFFLRPLIFITEKFTILLTRGQKSQSVTEDEILAMVRLGTREGEISKEEGNIVHNLISLDERKVREIMTPRIVIFSLNASLSIEEAANAVDGQGFSRVPVYEHDKENIIGYVLAQEIQSARNQEQSDKSLKDFLNPITFVPDTTNCLNVLLNFLKHRKHLAIVTDEYEGVDGLVTLEDLLETMLGTEIVDENDPAVDLQELARKRAAKRGGRPQP